MIHDLRPMSPGSQGDNAPKYSRIESLNRIQGRDGAPPPSASAMPQSHPVHRPSVALRGRRRSAVPTLVGFVGKETGRGATLPQTRVIRLPTLTPEVVGERYSTRTRRTGATPPFAAKAFHPSRIRHPQWLALLLCLFASSVSATELTPLEFHQDQIP